MTAALQQRLSDEWAAAKPIIKRAVKYGKYSIEQIEEKVLTLKWALWRGESSAIITENWENDFGPVLTICYAGGELDEVLNMYEVIEDMARDMGCVRIYIMGRPGWKKVMKSRGYSDDNMISKELR